MSATVLSPHAHAPHAQPGRPAAPKPREMMHLNTRSDARGAARMAIHVALIVACGVAIHASSPFLLPVAMLAMGVVQAALFAVLHETGHYTAFRSRRANAVVGWLATLPSTNNWHFYQQFHLAHHKHTQDAEHRS